MSFKDRKDVLQDLKASYRAPSEAEAARQLEAFAAKWNQQYPLIAKSWQSNWARLIPMFAYPEDIRRAIYTTNVIESLNMTLRKTIKTRAAFPHGDAAFKLLYLALQNSQKKWTLPLPHWSRALNAFVIIFEDRVPLGTLNSFTQNI